MTASGRPPRRWNASWPPRCASWNASRPNHPGSAISSPRPVPRTRRSTVISPARTISSWPSWNAGWPSWCPTSSTRQGRSHLGRHGTRGGHRGVLPRAPDGQGIKPLDKVTRWIEGTLAQVADPHLISMSRAAAGQMSPGTSWRAADQEMMRPLRDLLVEPVAALGSNDVERDVEAVFNCTAATMRRYMGSATAPGADDIAHVVRFCLRGLGAG